MRQATNGRAVLARFAACGAHGNGLPMLRLIAGSLCAKRCIGFPPSPRLPPTLKLRRDTAGDVVLEGVEFGHDFFHATKGGSVQGAVDRLVGAAAGFPGIEVFAVDTESLDASGVSWASRPRPRRGEFASIALCAN